MNEILYNRDMLINSNAKNILGALPGNKGKFNSLWGPEYIILNEKRFVDKNAGGIIEIMIKSRKTARY